MNYRWGVEIAGRALVSTDSTTDQNEAANRAWNLLDGAILAGEDVAGWTAFVVDENDDPLVTFTARRLSGLN